MENREFSGKTVDEALTAATIALGVTSDMLEYEVVEKGSSGFLGLGSKDALIRVRSKDAVTQEEEEPSADAKVSVESTPEDSAEKEPVSSVSSASAEEKKESAPSESRHHSSVPVDQEAVKARVREFLDSVFQAMELEVSLDFDFDSESNTLSVDMSGPNMGLIIGKRGQTLDSLQYLTSLVANKKLEGYVRIKLDTEDYRRRRKETLENLAKNVAFKVKRSKRSVSLEPMNPYERRVIHFALQNDSYVTTYSEGEEPYRHVVVALK